MKKNLCEECRLLDWDEIQRDSYILKPSWAALVKSANDGCRLCGLIEYMEPLIGMFEPYDENQGEDDIILTSSFDVIQGSAVRRRLAYLQMLAVKSE
jgi:hypothetical protein